MGEGNALSTRVSIGEEMALSESGFTHGDLLRGHNQYVGRSLKVNGSFCRDAYTIFYTERKKVVYVVVNYLKLLDEYNDYLMNC